jgi:hypothetical protein
VKSLAGPPKWSETRSPESVSTWNKYDMPSAVNVKFVPNAEIAASVSMRLNSTFWHQNVPFCPATTPASSVNKPAPFTKAIAKDYRSAKHPADRPRYLPYKSTPSRPHA